jgi:hypothetical protein
MAGESYNGHVSNLQKGRPETSGAGQDSPSTSPQEPTWAESPESVSALQMLDRVRLELATQGAAPSMPLLRNRIAEN